MLSLPQARYTRGKLLGSMMRPNLCGIQPNSTQSQYFPAQMQHNLLLVSAPILESLIQCSLYLIMTDFRDYMGTHGHVFSHVPVEGEVWISQSWGGYHQWEDGRLFSMVNILACL